LRWKLVGLEAGHLRGGGRSHGAVCSLCSGELRVTRATAPALSDVSLIIKYGTADAEIRRQCEALIQADCATLGRRARCTLKLLAKWEATCAKTTDP
jgi:hypothetical protein